MDSIVKIDPEIMHGTPCFAGTRVPVKILFDYLHGGETIDEFLEPYPTIRREWVDQLLSESLDYAVAAARVAKFKGLRSLVYYGDGPDHPDQPQHSGRRTLFRRHPSPDQIAVRLA